MAKESSELKKWTQILNVSDSFFKPQMEKVDLYMKYYQSRQWHDKEASDRYNFNPVDNMLYANTRVIVPRLNFRNPKIFVTPRKKPYRAKEGIVDTTSIAVAQEILLNYYYKHLKTKRETRRCLFDALIGSYGIMEVGYTLLTEKIKGGKKDGDLLIVDELIKAESPYMVRRSPKDVRWDIEARDSSLTDARWISLDWVRELDDVKSDPRFSNTSKLKANFTVKTDINKSDNDHSSEDMDMANNPELWNRVKGRDIWDKKTNSVFTLVKGHDRLLRKEEWPLFYDEAFPIETLFFNEKPDHSIPIADFDIYKAAQDELNQTRAAILDHQSRISQRKIFVQEQNMTEDAMRDYMHGGDGTIVEVKNIEQVKNAADPTISQDWYVGISSNKASIREMSGVSPTEALATTKFDQATEPALLEKSATTIREDQRDIFEDFLVRNVKKLGQVLQQVLPETDIPLSPDQFEESVQFLESKLYKIVGTDSTAIFPWLTLSKKDIQGDFDYDIEVGSTQAVNEETRKQDITQLSQLLANSPFIKQREANVRILEAFGEKDIDRLLKTAEEAQKDQAQQQQAAQQPSPDQQVKTQADLAKTDKKSQTQIQVAQIKAGTEQKKTQANLLAGMLKDADKRGNRQ